MQQTFYVVYSKTDKYNWKTTQLFTIDTMDLNCSSFEAWSLALAKAEKLKPENSEIVSIELSYLEV